VRILGVDPGSRATGWAVVSFDGPAALRASGVLRPPVSLPFERRLLSLYEGLVDVIDRERPDAAAVERVFSGVNPQSLITLGEARGVLLLALAARSVPSGEMTPAEVKRAVTGTGKAEKEQVRRMLTAILPETRARRLPLDAADAAAIALAYGYRHAIRGARVAARPAPRGEAGPPREAAERWKRRPAG
jgi:crossover junction endodeoxyribonuclease RuvC